jgi:hypothetical protein
MYDTRNFTVEVRYLSSDGPCVALVSAQACSEYHAVEVAYTKMSHIQPNRAMYKIAYKAKKTHQQLKMKREQQLLAGYAEAYVWRYN